LEDFVRHVRDIAVQKRSARRVLLQERHHFANQNYIIAAATFQANPLQRQLRSAARRRAATRKVQTKRRPRLIPTIESLWCPRS
jgi:hypothetical protein